MTDEELELLAETLGRANAALSLGRMLAQTLVEAGVIAAPHVLNGLDACVLSVEQAMGDPRATPDLSVQLREMRSTLEVLGALPAFRKGRK